MFLLVPVLVRVVRTGNTVRNVPQVTNTIYLLLVLLAINIQAIYIHTRRVVVCVVVSVCVHLLVSVVWWLYRYCIYNICCFQPKHLRE